MKIKKRPLLYIIIALIASVAVILFLPRPIVKNSDACSIYRIEYNSYFNNNTGLPIEVTNYNEDEILACLSRYKELRTLSKSENYCMGDVKVEISILTPDGPKHILLGNRNLNYSYSTGLSKYRILQSDNLRLELLQILDMDSISDCYESAPPNSSPQN